MTGLENFLDEIKLRLRNPFVASFIISWLFWNWEIWLGLFCLSDETLRLMGFSNYIDYVKFKLETSYAIGWPLLSSLTLILLLPVIRNIVEWYQAWTLNWGEKLVFKASKNEVISFEKYLQKREESANQLVKLNNLAADELKLKAQVEENEKTIANFNIKLHELNELYNIEKAERTGYDNIQAIDGNWKVIPPIKDYKEITISNKEVMASPQPGQSIIIGQVLFVIKASGSCYAAFHFNETGIWVYNFSKITKSNMTGLRNEGINVKWEKEELV